MKSKAQELLDYIFGTISFTLAVGMIAVTVVEILTREGAISRESHLMGVIGVITIALGIVGTMALCAVAFLWDHINEKANFDKLDSDARERRSLKQSVDSARASGINVCIKDGKPFFPDHKRPMDKITTVMSEGECGFDINTLPVPGQAVIVKRKTGGSPEVAYLRGPEFHFMWCLWGDDFDRNVRVGDEWIYATTAFYESETNGLGWD